MRIALLTTDGRTMGGESDVPEPWFGAAPEALLEGFAADPSVEVHVVSCTRRVIRAPEKLASNIYYHSLVVPRVGWMRTFYQGTIRAVRRKLRVIQPDIVHGQGTELDCAMNAAFSGFPNVVTLHGIMREQGRLIQARVGSFYWWAGLLERVALRRTVGVFCNSRYTENSVSSLCRRTWRVANPLRLEIFDAPQAHEPPRRPVLLNIGQVCPRKRQVELLDLADELHRASLGCEILFLGAANPASSYAARFLERVREHPCASYRGFLSGAELIKQLDGSAGLLHVPSEESFGLVVAEALARNLKLFGFQVGGIPDIAKHVEGAELYRDGDWSGLMRGVSQWLQKGASKPVAASAVMRERYHPEVIARRHLEIYREVLSTCS